MTKLRGDGVGQSAYDKINVHDKIFTFILFSLLYIVIFHTIRFPMLIYVKFYSKPQLMNSYFKYSYLFENMP